MHQFLNSLLRQKQGHREKRQLCQMQVTPTCDLFCMLVTEQKPFPRKRVLDNYNIVILCPSLSRKKHNLEKSA